MRSPAGYALIIGLSYATVGAVYISLSGELVAGRATDVETLRRLELAKGLGFVLVTAFALFATCLYLFQRIADRAARLAESQRAQIDAERRALPGLLAASIAHDFNNLLAILRCALEEFDTHLEDDEARLALEDARDAVDRADQLARRLSQSGRSTAVQGATPSTVDLAALATSVVELLGHHPAAKSRHLSAHISPAVLEASHAGLLHQMVTNLVLNGLQATHDGGCVEVRVWHSGRRCVLEVHDDGHGVSDERKARLSEAYFTTKTTGTGLGLLSARMCAEVHGGHLEITDSELGGALFRVTLDEDGVTDPLTEEDAAPIPWSRSPSSLAHERTV